MKSRAFVCAMVALSLLSSPFAFGQGRGNRDDRGQREGDQRRYEQPQRHDNGRHMGQQRRANPQWRQYERGAGPEHSFHPGARLPMQYRSHQYVVDDWRGHQLSAPPRGYHWVQTGGDYVLAAIATGIILELLLNN